MGLHTPIQWCDSTINVQMGCKGCELWDPRRGIRHCYAGALTERHAGSPGYPEAFDKPRLFLERIDEALRWKDLRGTVRDGTSQGNRRGKTREPKPWLDGYPRTIFLNDMGDTFTEGLPVDWLLPHVPRMAASPHVWIVLTKRHQRMLKFVRLCRRSLGGLPKNFWLCVSLTNEASLGRVPYLLKIREELPGHVLGLSIESLLADLAPLLRDRWPDLPGKVSWVKIGGESDQPNAPARLCCLSWIRGLVEFFRPHAPVFVKQLGSHVRHFDPGQGGARVPLRDGHGGDWREWPEDLQVREMPLPVRSAPGPAS